MHYVHNVSPLMQYCVEAPRAVDAADSRMISAIYSSVSRLFLIGSPNEAL